MRLFSLVLAIAGLQAVQSVQHHPHRHQLHHLRSQSFVQMKGLDEQARLYEEMIGRVKKRMALLPKQFELIDDLVANRQNDNVFRGAQTADHYFNAALVGERGPKLKEALGDSNAFYRWLMSPDLKSLVEHTHCKEIRGTDESAACAECVKNGILMVGLWMKQKSACYALLPPAFDERTGATTREAKWDCMTSTEAFLNKATERRCNRDACVEGWPLLDDVNAVVFGEVQGFFLNLIRAMRQDPRPSQWPAKQTIGLLIQAMRDLLTYGRDQSVKYRLIQHTNLAVLERNKRDNVPKLVETLDQLVDLELQQGGNIVVGAEDLYNSVVGLLEMARAMHPHLHTHARSQLQLDQARFQLRVGRGAGEATGVGAAQVYLRSILQLEDHAHDLDVRKSRCKAIGELADVWLTERAEWPVESVEYFDEELALFSQTESDPLFSPDLVAWLKDPLGEDNDFYKLVASVDALKVTAKSTIVPSLDPPFWLSASPEVAGRCVACVNEAKLFVLQDEDWGCWTEEEQELFDSTATISSETGCIDTWPLLVPLADTNVALLAPAKAALTDLMTLLKTATAEDWPEETALAILGGVLEALFQFGFEPSVPCRLVDKYIQYTVADPKAVDASKQAFTKAMQLLAPDTVLTAITEGAKKLLAKIKS